jgi:hypothetical protein
MKAIIESLSLTKAENGTVIRIEYKIEQEPTPKNPNPYPEYRTKTAVSEDDLIEEILSKISDQIEEETSEMEDEDEMENGKKPMKPMKSMFNPKNWR